ncbi:MAG: ATP-binding protein [Clostridia bacterium]
MNDSFFSKTMKIFEDRRKQNIDILEKRKNEVYSKSEAIKAIDLQMKENAFTIIKNIFTLGVDENIKKKNLELKAQKIELLTNLGYKMNYLDEIFNCKKCKDKGFIGTKRCECFEKELKKQRLMGTNLGSSITEFSFENFNFDFYSKEINPEFKISPYDNAKNNFRFLKKYTNNFSNKSQNIMMVGSTGLGKTFLSTAVAKEIIEKGFSVIFDCAQNIIETSEQAFFQKNKLAILKVEQYKCCDLLIIDDLGTEMTTSFSESALYNIINTRLIKRNPTIISSNVTSVTLNERYTQQLVSRLTGEYVILQFIGEDIRPKKLRELCKK